MCVQVFAWGLNTSGQLGLNDALVRKSPAVVDALWAMPVQQLAAGQHHACITLSQKAHAMTLTAAGWNPAQAYSFLAVDMDVI